MDLRSFESGAAGSPPSPPASPSSGYPTNGNPAGAVPATKPGEYWFHQIGEELRNVILAGGLTPDDADLTQLSQAIVELIAAALAGVTTPPQFDNDTSVATTEFVQRALGNISEFTSLAANTTLAASYAGKAIYVSGGTGVTLTLPLLSAVPNGTVIEFFCANTAGLTVQRQGTDDIYMKSAPTYTSLSMSNGDTAKFVSRGTYWVVVGGSAQLGHSAAFGGSLAVNGYQQLPSGLIIQWGTVAAAANPNVFTLPITFPNAGLRAYATFQDNSAARFATAAIASTSQVTTTGRTDAGAVVTTGELIQILAIGY